MVSAPIPKKFTPCSYVPVSNGEIIKIGAITLRVLEDGSRTDNRLSVAEITVPPRTPGPPAHFHQMHDEGFTPTKGKLRFHLPQSPLEDGRPVPDQIVDASAGDWVTVPIGAPHTFENPWDEEATFLNTFTPAFYINYFKMLQAAVEKTGVMTKEANVEAMEFYATVAIERGEKKA